MNTFTLSSPDAPPRESLYVLPPASSATYPRSRQPPGVRYASALRTAPSRCTMSGRTRPHRVVATVSSRLCFLLPESNTP